MAERARKEAEKLGLGLEEYIIELLAEGLDPKDRAQEYVEAALELLGQAREELERGDIRQAAEKLWGATALAIKAYAWLRDGRRLASHGELWEYSKRLIDELGEWVFDAWMAANGMHTCFYEGWCTRGHVERALKRIERLVREVATRVKAGR
ncbi:PaREP1 family protein [Pyrolobus fumarii 1A]|uniref:PaREP1 family protein n=1 Tax=Pyrolobus fumarii (strain DSM 11204 / 1A) TaxID=694429 RepID=G0EH13_PYRF1|nr:PaREP1 family protein [Pyrolobus fumarii 1A]